MKTSKILFALAVSAGLMAVTAARADEWHDHEMHARDWRHHHHHHEHGGPVIVQEPNVVYAPPVIVAPPPPPADDEPSGLNLVFPINIH